MIHHGHFCSSWGVSGLRVAVPMAAVLLLMPLDRGDLVLRCQDDSHWPTHRVGSEWPDWFRQRAAVLHDFDKTQGAADFSLGLVAVGVAKVTSHGCHMWDGAMTAWSKEEDLLHRLYNRPEDAAMLKVAAAARFSDTATLPIVRFHYSLRHGRLGQRFFLL